MQVVTITKRNKNETMATSNPIVFRILTDDSFNTFEILRQLKNNTLDLSSYGENITDDMVIALAENCEYLEDIKCIYTKVSATGRQLIQEVKMRPKPPPLEEGWWMDDGTGPQCKGMMN